MGRRLVGLLTGTDSRHGVRVRETLPKLFSYTTLCNDMNWSVTRLGAVVATVFLLLGVAGIVGGGYVEVTDTCESGHALDISRLSENNTGYNASNDVPFAELSPVEQRIFLEAYTDEHGISPIYEEWPESRFEGTTVIEYRDARYQASKIIWDCGGTPGMFLIAGGVVSVLVGVGVIVQGGALRRWKGTE